MHKPEYDAIELKINADVLLRGKHISSGNCDVMDLIVALIAKENMPIRIVESEYFTQLLHGNLLLRVIKFFLSTFVFNFVLYFLSHCVVSFC